MYTTLPTVIDKEFTILMKIRLFFMEKKSYKGLFYHAIYVEYNKKAYVYKYWTNPDIKENPRPFKYFTNILD